MQLDEHFQRRLNEARMFFAEGKALAAEKIYRDLLKPDLPAGGRVLVLDGLGRCLHIQGRLEEAETFFRESLRFLEELFGPNHIHVAGGLQNLARLRSERGECEEAATLGERALDILKQNLPADDLRHRGGLHWLERVFSEHTLRHGNTVHIVDTIPGDPPHLREGR